MVSVTGSAVDPVTGIGRALGLGAQGIADPISAPGDPAYAQAELVPDVVRHEEQLRVSTRRIPAERVRLVRRIVTETRMVPVEVRREVLDVERTPINADSTGVTGIDPLSAEVPVAPVRIVLHEEVPQFTMAVRAVEAITVSVAEVVGTTAVRAEVSAEQIEVVNVPPTAPRV